MAIDFEKIKYIYLVGVKGTGMTALAEILAQMGKNLAGSDVADVFYTDAILRAIGVQVYIGFNADNVYKQNELTQLVIYSAAYDPQSNPELVEAQRLGIPIMVYPAALGELSRHYHSSGIAGVHGKTTTTALAGSIAAALNLPATILAGSAVTSFGNRSTKIIGNRYLIAETCEYRNHFLHFHPRNILLTSIESDHQDFFPTYTAIYEAFKKYCLSIAQGGSLIYCADDAGARSLAQELHSIRPDIKYIDYGWQASEASPYKITSYTVGEGVANFCLACFNAPLSLKIPGQHLALNTAGALALVRMLAHGDDSYTFDAAREFQQVATALADFRGSKRRSEIYGEARGVLFMDDYGHHPTAIAKTVAGIKEFYHGRRLVLSFMSHTYSRTKALLADFVSSLDGADVLVLHKIYASARETVDPSVSGMSLFDGARARLPARPTYYFHEITDGIDELCNLLQPGDIFLSMGAGDNWKLTEQLYKKFQEKN